MFSISVKLYKDKILLICSNRSNPYLGWAQHFFAHISCAELVTTWGLWICGKVERVRNLKMGIKSFVDTKCSSVKNDRENTLALLM